MTAARLRKVASLSNRDCSEPICPELWCSLLLKHKQCDIFTVLSTKDCDVEGLKISGVSTKSFGIGL